VPSRLPRFTLAFAVLCLGALSAAGQAPALTIAAASDLQAVLPAIAAQFEKDTGQKVTLIFGSSGNFFTQIQNGAPFDVFFSADIEHPRDLERAGLTVPGSLYEYAIGRIVLWTLNGSGVDLRQGLRAILDPKVRRIAIANPEHAPYGRAAVAALRHEQVYDQVREKLVLGENISQVAQFAQSGNAQVGIVALSLALAPAMKSSGSYTEIPESFHPPIEQAAVVLKRSRQSALAQRFLDTLRKPENVRTLQSFGFAVPAQAAR